MLTTLEQSQLARLQTLSRTIRTASLAKGTVRDLTSRWRITAPSYLAVQLDWLVTLVKREAAEAPAPEGDEPSIHTLEMVAQKGARQE